MADPIFDLLFGLQILRDGFIDERDLFAAVPAWAANRERPLSQILVDQGAVDTVRCASVETEVSSQLKRPRKDSQSLPSETNTLISPPHPRPNSEDRGGGGGTTLGGAPDLTLPIGVDSRVDPGLTIPGTRPKELIRDEGFTLGAVGPDMPRFRVLRSHAKGGLGVVSVALDAELNREVALKQIQDDLVDDPVSQSRFLLEAEITGRLEHPGIVPVYGMGMSADGRLYYAMRFIRGESLAKTINTFHRNDALKGDAGRRSLELRKLLGRFIDVCNTMEYAHGRGVWHRDLKPDNIMVGQDGETLVVDWGVAKVTGRSDPKRAAGEAPIPQSSAAGLTETRAGTTLGTPAYMSPEQAAGDLENLSARSDVYSLGATLYTLLTNHRPFEGKDIKVLLREVRLGSFPPPRVVDRSIDPALEAVCLKAMANAPIDRYASARELADDIERWLADEPVSARRTPLLEKVQRWMRHKRTAVTAGAAAVFVAMIGLGGMLAVQAKANENLREANDQTRRFALAQKAIRTFHTGVSEDLLLGQSEFKELRDKLLASALEFYGELEVLLKGRSDDESLDSLARAYSEVGNLTFKIGSSKDALTAHRQALAIRETLATRQRASTESIADVGRSKLSIGEIEREMGDHGDAEDDLRAGKSLLEQLASNGQATPEILSELALGYEEIGKLLDLTNSADKVLDARQRAREIREVLVQDQPASRTYRANLAKSYRAISEILEKMGNVTNSLAACETAKTLRQALVDEDPTNKDYQLELARSETQYGNLLDKAQRPTEALASHRRAIELNKKLVIANPAVTDYKSDLARSHLYTAQLLPRIGKSDEAVKEYGEARDLYQELVSFNRSLPKFQANLVATLVSLGSELVHAGRMDEARATFERSRAVEEELALSHPKVPFYRYNLALIDVRIGGVDGETGRLDEALVSFRRAREIQEKLKRDDPTVKAYKSNLAWSDSEIGGLLVRTGQVDAALVSFQSSLKIREELESAQPGDPTVQADIATTRVQIARLKYEAGQSEEALALCHAALGDLEKLFKAHPTLSRFLADLATILTTLGDLLSGSGRNVEAIAAHERARALRQDLLKASPNDAARRIEVTRSEERIAILLARTGQLANASALLEKVRADRLELRNAHPSLVEVKADLAGTEDQLGCLLTEAAETSEAIVAHERAVSLWAELVEGFPSEVAYRLGSIRSLRDLARHLDLANNREEAAVFYQRARGDAESGQARFPLVDDFRVEQALCDESLGDLSARNGQYGQAADSLRVATKVLEQHAHARPGDLIHLARVHSRLAGLASLLTAERSEHAKLALSALQTAARVGYRNAELVRTEPAFAALLSRDEFLGVLLDLAFPDDPFQH